MIDSIYKGKFGKEVESLPETTLTAISNLKAETVNFEGKAVNVLGYYAKGDGGGGLFYWDATSTQADNGGTIIQATAIATGRWKRVFSGAVNVKWFGAKGDGINDDQPSIQSAVNFCLEYEIKNVFVPDGQFLINDSIFLGKSIGFSSVILEGAGYAYKGEAGFSGTTILANFSDRMAIDVRGSRGSYIRKLTIKGQLFDYIDSNGLGHSTTTPTYDDTLRSNWVDPNLNPLQDSRYAPYAAITIDGYAGIRPIENSYPGNYGSSYSSDVQIDKVQIIGFNTGVANQPSDVDGNGDFTKLREVLFSHCMFGLSVGNTQSRNVLLDNVNFTMSFTCLTNNKHGKQNGRFDGICSNLSTGSIINIFDFGSTAFLGSVKFTSFYAEGLYRLGFINNTSSNENSIIFESSTFKFGNQNEDRGYPSDMLVCSSDFPIDISFNGCSFSQFYSILSLRAPFINLKRCRISPKFRDNSYALQKYERIAHNTLAGGLITSQFIRSSYQNIFFKMRNIDNDSSIIIELNDLFRPSRKYGTPTYASRIVNESIVFGKEHSIYSPNKNDFYNKNDIVNLSIIGDILTFDNEKLDWQIAYFGPYEGDVLIDSITGTTFFVVSNDGASVTAKAQNNLINKGTGLELIIPINWSTGQLYIISGRLYLPDFKLFGDIGEGEAVIKNCSSANNYSAFISNIPIGDYMYFNNWADKRFSEAGGKIVSVNTIDKTIQLTRTAEYTSFREEFNYLIRM